ncbi:hypothetical protein MWU65_05810 [Cellulophaga sp. F20128]|uniref:hypothetical protein n=1 Tax=Cellulophaga sp. F20128 TaxID=2926413 RepID=UPI001FF20A69|nr:hypothetical protein [Cellulophaga sp. F20128]MCK0156685.1 hypothetical protein [Cellulophaga sp. F20128]
MTCLECKNELSHIELKNAIDAFGVALCTKHQLRLNKLILKNKTPKEAIQLYYGLKEKNVNPMLEWWDGKKSVDIAISRVKLNIEIDTEYNMLTHEQALNDLEEAMHSFKNGFTTIKIPNDLVRHHFKETVNNIMGIVEGLNTNIKKI